MMRFTELVSEICPATTWDPGPLKKKKKPGAPGTGVPIGQDGPGLS